MSNAVLVTGGAGYVGSHTCLALKKAGYQPIVYDDLSRGHRWAVRFGPLEEGNILDTTRLCEVIQHHRPIAVIHFAGLTYVGESIIDPAPYYLNNVVGTLSILEAMRKTQVDTIVFSSTAAVYGVPVNCPIPENAPLMPINPYGNSKLTAEKMLGDFANAYGIKSMALRYFNASGADPEARIGESHDPETHLIPLVLDVAAGRRSEIHIFGDDYDTADGTCIRDYVHVLDLADAHIQSLKFLRASTDSKMVSLNLGNGYGASVSKVVEISRSVTGRPIPVIASMRREGDPPVLVADPSRAKALLGWHAARPALNEQISDAWKWHQVHYGVSAKRID